MEIKTINKHNRYYHEIINTYYKWWGKEKKTTLKEIDELYKNKIEEKELPIIRALIINDTLIGFYELNEKDNIDEEKYTPYLANVFVKEIYRNQGYGAYLIKDAIKLAGSLNYKELYLHSRLENFYEKYGFEFLKEVDTKLGKKRIYKIDIKE